MNAIVSNIPVYQDVTRTPNVMVNLNPLKKTQARVVTLEQRMKELTSNRNWQNLMTQYKNKKQRWNPSARPSVKMVTLDKILIDEDIQRSLDRKHAVRIADPAHFDPRLLQVIFCVKIPGQEIYHAVDGQHTATVLALMISEGLFDGEQDWRKVEVCVSYVETADKSFSRNAFALINGRGKKKISKWYQHRTQVQSVRIDGSRHKEDVAAEAKQTICEQNLCFPVDKDSDLVSHAGTFTHMEALNLDNATLELSCKWHNRYFHYHNIDGSLWFVIPDIVTSCRNGRVKFDQAFQGELAGIVQALFGSLRQFHSSVKTAYAEWYRDRNNMSSKGEVEWKSDALGCALAQLYVRLGGLHPVPRTISERYDGLTNWFDSSVTALFVK